MKYLGQVTIFDRPVYLVGVADFGSLSALNLPSEHSVILLAADAGAVKTEVIFSAAAHLIGRGAIYVCTWGADCERVHDIFDEAEVGDGSKISDEILMTTWHCGDSLEEAVEFFLTSAFPTDPHLETCSWVAIAVGDTACWESVESTVALTIRRLDFPSRTVEER